MYLEKEKTLICRDTEGKLLPIDVTLEMLSEKPITRLTPFTKGEIQQLHAKPEDEDRLIREHCFEPSYTEDEFKYIKTSIYSAIKIALLSISTDTSQADLQLSMKQNLTDEESKKKIT